jgi:hypothetical protein
VVLGFERIRALLAKLENPREELKTVQIVGTNGKEIAAVEDPVTCVGRIRPGFHVLVRTP